MRIRDIAFFSLTRQKGKKIFLLVAIMIGCLTVVSLFSFVQSQRNKIESQFDEYGANIIVSPKADNLSISYGGVNVSPVIANLQQLHKDDVEKIFQIPNKYNIRAVSPKLIGSIQVSTKELAQQKALLVGINFKDELKIKNWWEVKGSVPQTSDQIIIGSDVSQRFTLNLGDAVEINGKSLKITGILDETGSNDDKLIFADLGLASKLLKQPLGISLIEVSALCSDCPIDELISQISEVIPHADVKGVRQIMKQKMQMLAQFEKFAYVVSAVVVGIGCMLVFSAMMGSVSERKKEIAIFRTIGFKRKHIMQIVLLEAFIISLLAGVLGVLVGWGLSRLILPWITQISTELISFNKLLLFAAPASVLALSVAAAFYPAKTAADIDPVIALRSV
ncbi:ABC transporter permease [Candidatus Margulisiibacteriota bacterium]